MIMILWQGVEKIPFRLLTVNCFSGLTLLQVLIINQFTDKEFLRKFKDKKTKVSMFISREAPIANRHSLYCLKISLKMLNLDGSR